MGTILVGMATRQQFEAALAAVQKGPLPAAALERLTAFREGFNEEARDYARSLTGTPEFERSSNERKKVEMRFAHLKVQHRFERMRLRGLCGARDEFHLAAIVQNLKTLANRLSQPPPNLPAAYSA